MADRGNSPDLDVFLKQKGIRTGLCVICQGEIPKELLAAIAGKVRGETPLHAWKAYADWLHANGVKSDIEGRHIEYHFARGHDQGSR